MYVRPRSVSGGRGPSQPCDERGIPKLSLAECTKRSGLKWNVLTRAIEAGALRVERIGDRQWVSEEDLRTFASATKETP